MAAGLWRPVRGRLVLCVDSRKAGFAGRRREFWPTEALASAEGIARLKENSGAAGFAELAPADRRDAAEALAHLGGAGSLLEAAIVFVRERERRARAAHVPTVTVAIGAYLAAKGIEQAAGNLSRLTLDDLKSKMRIVAAAFGPLKVTEIDESAVATFIRNLPHPPRGRANIRTKLSQFLNYCRREGKWITTNPTENVKVRVKNAEVKILSVEAAAALLLAALNSKRPASVVPFIAVQLFAGLRPYEAARLTWERIHFETKQIEVLASTSKTRETRFVELAPLLAECLWPYRLTKGPITGPRFVSTLAKVKTAAGFTVGVDKSNPWPTDVLRHCFGSYWLAVHKDRAHLAELMGTSLDMIKTHYKRAIPEPLAKEFWKLSPAIGKPAKIIPISSTA